VPEESLRDGRNTVEVLEPSAGGFRLLASS
jgi:hypothetical protein